MAIKQYSSIIDNNRVYTVKTTALDYRQHTNKYHKTIVFFHLINNIIFMKMLTKSLTDKHNRNSRDKSILHLFAVNSVRINKKFKIKKQLKLFVKKKKTLLVFLANIRLGT